MYTHSNIDIELTMGQKLKMFREINKLSQAQLGQKLNITDKTISAWELGEREITLQNAKLICQLFNIPESFFVFNENFEKIDYRTQESIKNYLKEKKVIDSIQFILNKCNEKLLSDNLPPKKEYLPIFDYDKRLFTSFGLFKQSSLPIEQKTISDFSFGGKVSLDSKKIVSNIKDLNNINLQYDVTLLLKENLFDTFYKYYSDTVEIKDLYNCNNIGIFEKTLENMKSKKYTERYGYGGTNERDISDGYIQKQLNNVLERLNPNLNNFWKIIVFLIDNGAYYEIEQVSGSDVVCIDKIKDCSKTNLVYRIAKDKIRS